MHEMFLPRGLGAQRIARKLGRRNRSKFRSGGFLSTPTGFRLKRLRAREATHFGAAAVAPGGWRHLETAEFIEWASHYEDGDRDRCLNWLRKFAMRSIAESYIAPCRRLSPFPPQASLCSLQFKTVATQRPAQAFGRAS